MIKTVLITGVSSGLGRKTAQTLSENGYKVFGTIRTKSADIPGVELLEMDVTKRESVHKAISSIKNSGNRIDILINNAGMGIAGPVEDCSEEEIALQMNTNFTGMLYMVQAVLPLMRESGQGLIINISSIGGIMGLPFQAVYSASKFAVEGLSEGLRMELKSYGIKVVVIEPGDFNTEFTAKRKLIAMAGKTAYREQFIRSLAAIERDEKSGKKPELLAYKILKIIRKKNPANKYIVSNFEQKLAVFLKVILPAKWFAAILASHYSVK